MVSEELALILIIITSPLIFLLWSKFAENIEELERLRYLYKKEVRKCKK